MITKRYLFWTELDYLWKDILREDGFMIWSDISLIEEVRKVLKGGGSWAPLQKELERGNPWKKISESIGEQKTERFIKIFCTVNNIEYERGRFTKENIKVDVSNFEKIFNEKIKIKVDFKK